MTNERFRKPVQASAAPGFFRRWRGVILGTVCAVAVTSGIYPPPPQAQAALAVIDPAAIAQIKNTVTAARDQVQQAKLQVGEMQGLRNQLGDGIRLIKDAKDNPGAFAGNVAQCLAPPSLPGGPISTSTSLCDVVGKVRDELGVKADGSNAKAAKERRAQLRNESATSAVALGATTRNAVKQSQQDVAALRQKLSSAQNVGDVQAAQALIQLEMLDSLRSIQSLLAQQVELQGAAELDNTATVSAAPRRIQGLGSGGQ